MENVIKDIKNFGKEFPANYSIPRRKLGKTGEELSIIGFGGIMLNENSQDFANEIVAKAVELGVNYFDVAPKYGDAKGIGKRTQQLFKHFTLSKDIHRKRRVRQEY